MQGAGSGQAVQLMGCGCIGAALVLLAVCCWQAVQVGAVICCGGGALAWSSGRPRGHRAGSLLIRQARQECRRQGVEDGQKKKARAGGAVCAAALALSVLAVVIRCAGCIPVQVVGGGDLLPVPVPGPLLALIQAQRFQRTTFQRVTGAAAGAPSEPFLAVCRRGQILHLTGLRSRCRALT